MLVDKDQSTRRSEWFLLEPVIYSTMWISRCRCAEDLLRE